MHSEKNTRVIDRVIMMTSRKLAIYNRNSTNMV